MILCPLVTCVETLGQDVGQLQFETTVDVALLVASVHVGSDQTTQ